MTFEINVRSLAIFYYIFAEWGVTIVEVYAEFRNKFQNFICEHGPIKKQRAISLTHYRRGGVKKFKFSK